MPVDKFKEAMKLKHNGEKYAMWKIRVGGISLPEDFVRDNPKITPYFNLKCQSPECIYDLKKLRDIYVRERELNDSYEGNDAFECDYCQTTVTFNDFFTSKDLEKDVFDLIREDGGQSNPRNSNTSSDPSDSSRKYSQENQSYDDEEPNNQESYSEQSFSTIRTTDDMEIDFYREIPEINTFTEIELEEYCYIIETQKRDKIFRIDYETLNFNLTRDVRLPIRDFIRMVKNRELDSELYHVILFEYWRQIYVKMFKSKLPLYFFEIENESSSKPKLTCRDLTSRRLSKDDVSMYEEVIIVISVKKSHNLFLYNYMSEKLTYLSCDKKEHQNDEYSGRMLQKKGALFAKFNKMKFREDRLVIGDVTNEMIPLSNTLIKKVFVHYFVADRFLELSNLKLKNFFDVVLWVLFKLNMKSKEELSELANQDLANESVDSRNLPANDMRKKSIEKPLPPPSSLSKSSTVFEEPEIDTEEVKNFQNFYTLLWYYYYYDRKRYRQIWKEYERMFSGQVLQRAGINPQLLDVDLKSESEVSDSSIQSPIRRSILKSPSPRSPRKSLVLSPKRVMEAPPHFDSDVRLDSASRSHIMLPRIKSGATFTNAEPIRASRAPQRANMNMESLPPLGAMGKNQYKQKVTTYRKKRKRDSSVSTDYDDEVNEIMRRYKKESKVEILHKNNVRLFPHLYEESFERTKPNRPIPLDAVVDENLNSVTKEDVREFENSGMMTEALLNYFISFMRTKQEKMDQTLLRKYNLRSYFFCTDMFKLLVNDLTKKFYVTKYERVKHMSRPYARPNKSIFEEFQKIVIPVIEVINQTQTYKLIMVDTFRKSLTLYDPLTLTTDKAESSKENKHLIAVATFIEHEYFDKAGIEADVFNQWAFEKADCTATEDIRHSGLFVAFYLYILLKGQKQPFFRGKELNGFISKMSASIKKKMGVGLEQFS